MKLYVSRWAFEASHRAVRGGKSREKIFFVFKIAMAVKIIIHDSLMNLFGQMVHSGN